MNSSMRMSRHILSACGVAAVLLWAGAAHGAVNVIHDCLGTSGRCPDSVLLAYGGKLYGTTVYGGSVKDMGTVFSINPDGSGHTLLHEFTGGAADGEEALLLGPLVEIGGRLYGTTACGGDSNKGTVFAIDADGTDFLLLHEFSGADGDAASSPLSLHDGKLYGMTASGGAANLGVVYRLDPSGANFEVLHEFAGGASDGSTPYGAALVTVGLKLFGTTGYGGDDNCGTIFSMNPDGSGFTLLHEFSDTPDGKWPTTTLLCHNGSLYGTTQAGGSAGLGVLFRLPQGQPLEILHHFTGGVGDGSEPLNNALLLWDGRLHGTTSSGGDTDNGTIFSIMPDGTNYIVHHDFAGNPDGAYPVCGLMAYGQRLYGTTRTGGANNGGALYVYFDHTVTFRTDGTPGATLTGETVQTVVNGADCTMVEAVPPGGYTFTHWSGDHVGIDNPLTLTGVTGDMTVTANFAALVPVTLAVLPEGTGTTAPAPGPRLVPQGRPVAVTATAAEHHHFVRWLVAAGDVTIANPFAASTSITVNAGGGATVVARFAINAYRVEFRTDGTAGATLAGDLVQTVTHGSDCTAVSLATIPENLDFTGWSGDHVGMEDPLTLTNVTSDLAVTANFGRQFAYGSTFLVDAADVDGLPAPGAEFLVKPKVFAVYFDPVKDPDRETPKTATAKVLDKVTIAGKNPLEVEWRKKVKLFNQSLFKAALKVGQGADAWLAEGHQEPLALDVRLSSKELAEESVYAAQLRPPEITGVANNGDGTWTITGRHFGTKKPKVWREYLDDDVVKAQKFKVLSPQDLAFADAAGKPACMHHATDDSQVVVEVPAKDPGGLNGTIVLDNGVGMDTAGAPGGD